MISNAARRRARRRAGIALALAIPSIGVWLARSSAAIASTPGARSARHAHAPGIGAVDPAAAAIGGAGDKRAAPIDGASDIAAWRARLIADGRTTRLENVAELDCLRCHATVGEEWRASAHALAWQDELYQRELARTRKSQRERCYGCHIPVPLAALSEDPPEPPARTENPHLGITCATCHLDQDGVTILGVHGVLTDAHPTRRSERLAPEGDLCLACHSTTIGPVIALGRDYVASNQREVKTCIECHMSARRAPIANDPAGRVSFAERAGRSHRLESPRDPEFLAGAFALDAAAEGDSFVLRITNRAGHRIPGSTHRRLLFRLRALDAAGKPAAELEHVVDYQSYLPPDESTRIALPRRRATRLEVTVWHESLGLRRPVKILERVFEE